MIDDAIAKFLAAPDDADVFNPEVDAAEKLKELNIADEAEKRQKSYLAAVDNISVLDDLMNDIVTHNLGERWATGFRSFDDALGGGFLGGQVIFMGAISSLGKTSLALQIASQVAERGKDVLIFSLEMSKKELDAKLISMYSCVFSERNEDRITAKDVLLGNIGDMVFYEPQDEKSKLFKKSFDHAKEISSHLFIYVNENIDVDGINKLVAMHIEATGRLPLVVIDYLQILRPSIEAQTTDKRLLTNYDATALKALARGFNVPVLVISAFNRTNYLEPVNMASFRESSGIEYSSDILLGMQYRGMDYQKHWFTDKSGKKSKVYESAQLHAQRVRDLFSKMDELGEAGEPIYVELKILKQRFGVKKSICLKFLPAYSYYSESDFPAEIITDEWVSCELPDFLPEGATIL